MDVAKIGLNVEAKGVKQTFEELDKLAKSSSEVSKQMDKLVPLLTKFTNVDLNNQANKIKVVATEMAAFSVECNKMAAAVGSLRVSSAGLNDLKTVLSNLGKISTGGLSKHAENIQKLSVALSSGSSLGNASTQLTNLQTALVNLSAAPQTLTQIATAAGSFAGKSTSLNNFVKAVERLAVVSAQLPTIAQQIGTLAPALSNMSGVSAPVAALIAQLKALQGVMNATVSQANSAASQTSSNASRGSGGGGSGGYGVSTLVMASGVDASLAGAFSAAKGAVALADTMANLEARVKLVTNSSKELRDVQAQLFSEANRSGTSVSALTESYVALSRSTRALGMDQASIVDLSSKMSMAFKVGGGSAGSFNSAMIQMNQGLSSGVLRGQEFNSMSEQAPVLLAALRKGLEATTGAVGLTEGALRKMANAGKLTTDVVIPALEIGLKDIEKEFNNLPLTAERGWTVLMNSVAKTLGEMNKSTGTTNGIAESFISLGKTLENSKGALEGFASAIPIAALGALTLAMTQTSTRVVTGIAAISAAKVAEARATVTSTAAEVERLAVLNAGIPIWQRSTASIMASMEATRLHTLAQREAAFAITATGRTVGVAGGIFQAMGGWVTVAAVAITATIYYWDELAASLGNVAAKATLAEESLKRAIRLKDVGLIGARQGELKASMVQSGEEILAKEGELKSTKDLYKNSDPNSIRGQVGAKAIAAQTKGLEELKIKALEQKAAYDQASEAVKNITTEKKTGPVTPRTGVDTLNDELMSGADKASFKGRKAQQKLEEQTKIAKNMSLSLETRNTAWSEVAKLNSKSLEWKGKMYNSMEFEAITNDIGKAPKQAKAPKGLSSIQSGDSAANAALKEAQLEWNMLQNNTSESLDKLTTSGRKALQIEAQIIEAKKAGSKVSQQVIASKEGEFAIYNQAAAIEEKTILRKRQEAVANAEVEKTSKMLTKSISDTNEFLEARDDLIRTGSVVEVIDADQKKLLSLRKAFMSQLAEIDREIANSLSSKETATLIERREGLKGNYDKVVSQVTPADKFDLKSVEGVKGLESKSIEETQKTSNRTLGDLASQMEGASSSDVQLQLGEQYNTELEAQKQREIDIHSSAEEKLRSIEQEKINRHLSMIKATEAFANSMMDITSNEGKERLAKEKENFQNQSALYKTFFVIKKATAIAEATISGIAMAAEMGKWGAAMGGPAGAAIGQGLGYGIMAANIGVIAGTTIGMFAKGSAFDGGGVVSSPTAFSHGGGQGVMGEAGPEGILPLAKGPDGKLGVQTYGGDKSNGGGVSKITIVNQTTGRIDSVEERQISPYEKQIIIKEAVDVVNGNLANPNSSTSKAMNNNYSGMRRNR